MNYYIQGDPARADKIKAAFERLGINVLDFGFADKTVVYCSIGGCGGCVQYIPYSINLMHILYSHPDYQELELPKPHYAIANFQPFDKVLVRCGNDEEWMIEFYCKYDTLVHTSPHRDYPFMGIGDSYSQCIPFNDDTKHLLGTTDMPDEMYINW